MLVEADTDNPERFRPGQRVEIAGVGVRRIASVRGSRDALLVRLEGVADRATAASLRGKELRIPIAEARAAAAGYLWADLVGLEVRDESGRVLGTLAEVLRTGGEVDVFAVRDAAGRELLLPALESVVREIDLKGGRVVVRPQEEA